MRKLPALVVTTALLGASASTALAAAKTVKVGDNWFVRAGASNPTVRVTKGTTVAWRFVGNSTHTVSVRKGPVRFSSPFKVSGTYRRKMTRKGTYLLFCKVHSEQRMRLVVR
ncbi:MAG: hypothetical protein ACLGHT_01275 [Acidimicrobiia bacterium]